MARTPCIDPNQVFLPLVMHAGLKNTNFFIQDLKNKKNKYEEEEVLERRAFLKRENCSNAVNVLEGEAGQVVEVELVMEIGEDPDEDFEKEFERYTICPIT
ncbi:Uncharacterized protein Fot_05509 [Forsythia ovata]|uniref:Uncharacterized protein n=1 Tax=Forsythia ovata TaxID=205694 RepID=A0ABD1WQY1_9LAMI